ncbi:MAG: N-acetylmuramoyl-L-alanine amidase [Pseudomonadota bacterium]
MNSTGERSVRNASYPMLRPLFKYSLFATIITSICLASCAPPPRYTPSSRVEMKALDLSALQGRKIVIDPGHGGRFVGAVGAQGLRESDINLAVGLHLWGLFKQAGAQVWMTRSADVDLSPSQSANLTEDLEVRCQVSNQVSADIFISIHHNSNTKDPKKNDTEIYYKLTDPGSSQDLAGCVAEALREGNPVDDVHVLPGNFYVLRNTQAIALLGEASFISNRKNEQRLSLSNQLRREAEDYFLGILTYFQKGIPAVTGYKPDGITLDTAFPHIEATIVGGSDGEAINPEATKLYLDGNPAPARFDPQTGKLSYTPDKPLKNDRHIFLVEARNCNGNSAWATPVHFCVSLPPAEIKVSSLFSALPADGKSYSRIEITAFDYCGNPVIDGTLISLEASAGKLDTKTISTIAGKGIAYFSSPQTPEEVTIEASYQGIRGRTMIKCGDVAFSLVRISIKDPGNRSLEGVRVKGGEGLLGTTDRNGMTFISSDRSGEISLTLERPGYLPHQVKVGLKKGAYREEGFSLTPQENGVLLGKKIILDPEPWEEHTEREFGVHADAEKANLEVAQQIQVLLERAGAITTITRNSLNQHPTPGERVLTGEKFGGEYLITITHRNDYPYVSHYFRSQVGKQLAQTIAQLLKRELLLNEVVVNEGTDFTIIHSSAPSIVVNLGKGYTDSEEVNGEDHFMKEARGVYQGLVEFLRGKGL